MEEVFYIPCIKFYSYINYRFFKYVLINVKLTATFFMCKLWKTKLFFLSGMDQERVRLSREEDLYKQEMLRLEKDLSDLESTVEELRGNVINRKTRVNMSDVENMALILSKSSKTVADLKLRYVLCITFV